MPMTITMTTLVTCPWKPTELRTRRASGDTRSGPLTRSSVTSYWFRHPTKRSPAPWSCPTRTPTKQGTTATATESTSFVKTQSQEGCWLLRATPSSWSRVIAGYAAGFFAQSCSVAQLDVFGRSSLVSKEIKRLCVC